MRRGNYLGKESRKEEKERARDKGKKEDWERMMEKVTKS